MEQVNPNNELVREAIYRAFGGVCFYTGIKLEREFQIDHFVPKAKGGLDTVDNLVLARTDINRMKNDHLDSMTPNFVATRYLLETVYAPRIIKLVQRLGLGAQFKRSSNTNTKEHEGYNSILKSWETAANTMNSILSYSDVITVSGEDKYRLENRKCYSEYVWENFGKMHFQQSKIIGHKMGKFFISGISWNKDKAVIETELDGLDGSYFKKLFATTLEKYESDTELIKKHLELTDAFEKLKMHVAVF